MPMTHPWLAVRLESLTYVDQAFQPDVLALLEELNRRAVRLERDDGLLPVGQPADLEAEAAVLAQAVLRPHLGDLHAEQLLDRRLDLVLGRPLVDLEREGVAVRGLVRALLGDERPHDDLVRLQLRPARAGLALLLCVGHDSLPPRLG